jgi:hypothetical protein
VLKVNVPPPAAKLIFGARVPSPAPAAPTVPYPEVKILEVATTLKGTVTANTDVDKTVNPTTKLANTIVFLIPIPPNRLTYD